MQIYMTPRAKDFGGEESGIRRVVEAYETYLPQFGVTLVDNENDADLIVSHAGSHLSPDVLITHGLYFTADYKAPKWEYKVNAAIIAAARQALSVTVPSRWVAEVFERDMRLRPFILPHGIDWQAWQHNRKNMGYVLWNKNRNNVDVCNTEALERLAIMANDVPFISTFGSGKAPENVQVIGLQPHDYMMRGVQSAAVYLSTTKETFGIGVLEAMAAGVPVLGWNFGGNRDLVKHGVTGFLAEYGDYDGLVAGLRYCLKHRDVLGANSREVAREHDWLSCVAHLAEILQIALKQKQVKPSVSVVIPCYNYGDKVARAIRSAKEQTLTPDEVIVVDDGSNEQHAATTKRVCERYGATYLRKDNGGVATARNYGIQHAKTKYVSCLDADDAIAPEFLQVCVDALEADRSISIAYTGLHYIKPDGEEGLSPWPGEYNYDLFLRRQNQVPTCCVFKKEMWQRLGGYNQRYAPGGAGAEDAEFWLRAGAHGFAAKKVTNKGLFIYSWQSGRVSGDKGYVELDWTALHPWTKDGQHPFASMATPELFSHPVRQYDQPVISVIIPVGPGHTDKLRGALDSLESQTFRKWEAIVVWDTQEDTISIAKSYPYIREVVNHGKPKGAGWARNAGAKIARAPYLLFLDADDWLYPEALQRMLGAESKSQPAIVYSDYVGKAFIDKEYATKLENEGRLLSFNPNSGEAVIRFYSANYDCERACRQPEPERTFIWNLISSLVPKTWHNEIGGFDETMQSWEDWDYWIRLAKAGKCFVRINEPLVVYRFYTGNRRDAGLQHYPILIKYLKNKYERISNMPCPSCGGSKAQIPQTSASVVERQVTSMSDSDYVLIQYNHPNIGQHRVIGAATKTFYGYRGGGERFYAHRDDIAAQPGIYVPVNEIAAETEKTVVPEEPKQITVKPVEPKDTFLPKVDLTSTELTKLPGVSEDMATAMNVNGVHTVGDILKLENKDVYKIKGLGKVRLANIKEYIQSNS